jgi:hypothetical protein
VLIPRLESLGAPIDEITGIRLRQPSTVCPRRPVSSAKRLHLSDVQLHEWVVLYDLFGSLDCSSRRTTWEGDTSALVEKQRQSNGGHTQNGRNG